MLRATGHDGQTAAPSSAGIYYQVAGDGPPVVLIHGLSGSCRWWARNVDALARRFRVYVIDLLGFGSSRGERPFVLGEAPGHLAAWMDEIGLARASIAGHSMGGFVAADLVARSPGRVDRLVLVDAVAMPLGCGALRHALGLGHALWHLPVNFLPVLVTDACRAGARTIGRAARDLLAAPAYPALDRIQAPTLVVWGEHDRLVPLAHGRQLCRHLPAARLAVIPGAGHIAMWDRPDAFNAVVGEFLATPAPVARSVRHASRRDSEMGERLSALG